MMRMYAKRLLMPFVGVIQVAEEARARALSPDGENWAIQYALAAQPQGRIARHVADPGSQYALVATIARGRLAPRAVPPFLDSDDVRAAIHRLFDVVSAARVPFPAADRYEYWLLDGRDGHPLALLQSRVDAPDTAMPPPHPVWLAMPAAQLPIEAPESPQDVYVPPVNYRLEKLIEERAGSTPRAAWFERPDPAADDFPPCLIREDWDREEHQLWCDLYVKRLAPRLLMMGGLPPPVRSRLERAARTQVFEVDRFYPLYPEVMDRELLTGARVEARMRRANST